MAPEKNSLSYAMRAAISSACIFPGAGLFLLRHYVRGCIFAVPAAVVVLMLFINLFSTTLKINEELQRQADEGNFAFDVIAIFHQLHSALFTSPYWQDGKWILLASWLLSILSSYFVGKKLDMKTSAETP
jgi:hypothetical protein